jgi:hypothetical protein
VRLVSHIEEAVQGSDFGEALNRLARGGGKKLSRGRLCSSWTFRAAALSYPYLEPDISDYGTR